MNPLLNRKPWIGCLWALGLQCAAIGSLSAEDVPLAALRLDADRTRLWAEVSATLHAFTVEATRFSTSEIVVDLDAGRVVSARIAVPVKGLRSGNDRRDRKLRDWLSAGEHPEVYFELDRLERSQGSSIAIGRLGLNGVENVIRAPFEFEQMDGGARIEGAFRIDHREWDLPVIRMILLKVDPVFEVHFELQGVLDPMTQQQSK